MDSASFVKYLLLVLNILVPVLGAQSGYFTTPPAEGANNDYSDNPIYYVGQKVDVQFVTDLKETSMLIWQQGNGTSSATIYSNTTVPNNTYPWTVGLSYTDASFNLTANENTPGDVFFFAVYAPGATETSITSHYFNITKNAPSSVAPNGASQTSALPSSTAVVAPVVTTSPASSSSGLTSGQQAGVGVGVSLAGLLAITAAAWFFWFRRRGPAQVVEKTIEPTAGNPPTYYVQQNDQKGFYASELPNERRQRPQEMPVHYPTQELATPLPSQELPT